MDKGFDLNTREAIELRNKKRVLKSIENPTVTEQNELERTQWAYTRITCPTDTMYWELRRMFKAYPIFFYHPCIEPVRIRLIDLAIDYFQRLKQNDGNDIGSSIAEMEAKNRMHKFNETDERTDNEFSEFALSLQTFKENRFVSMYMSVALEYVMNNYPCYSIPCVTHPVLLKLLDLCIEYLNVYKDYEAWKLTNLYIVGKEAING